MSTSQMIKYSQDKALQQFMGKLLYTLLQIGIGEKW